MQTNTQGTQPANIQPFNYPSERSPVYAIAPGADAFAVKMLMEAKLAHLDAMLLAIYGDGGETFRNMNDTTQDEYLWACSYLASECRELFQQVMARGEA